ncbi:MAG: SDR family NAD(P)-dependent oxidoreductase [Candidatus Nanopelagicaceae bacterium]|jgi:NAD(P)-dependent dehydrogenase (short-subunit alcohol dehydrogenase family)
MTVLDRFRLDGKVAVVTGASSGLGVAFAKALSEAGADLILGARREERLTATGKLVEAAGRKYFAKKTDVTKPEDCEALIAFAIEKFGHVDILINNAGIANAIPATKESPEQFRQVIETNLMGAYWMAQAFAKANTDGGAIVNVASILGIKPQGLPQAAYVSSKAGLIGLTKDLATQWSSRKKIRVNAIAPGLFPSEMGDSLPPESIEFIKKVTPLGRLGDPEELAATVIWLVSDASSYVTGITVPVDGGLVMP